MISRNNIGAVVPIFPDIIPEVRQALVMEELIDLQTVAKPQSEIGISANVTSLELLQQVYRNPLLPLSTRMRAASTALPFEFPKLAVTASFTGEDFADQMDKAFSRSAKVIDAQAKMVRRL